MFNYILFINNRHQNSIQKFKVLVNINLFLSFFFYNLSLNENISET